MSLLFLKIRTFSYGLAQKPVLFSWNITVSSTSAMGKKRYFENV